MDFIEPCFGIGHNLSLICQMTSEDIKHQLIIIIMLLKYYLHFFSNWTPYPRYILSFAVRPPPHPPPLRPPPLSIHLTLYSPFSPSLRPRQWHTTDCPQSKQFSIDITDAANQFPNKDANWTNGGEKKKRRRRVSMKSPSSRGVQRSNHNTLCLSVCLSVSPFLPFLSRCVRACVCLPQI